MNTIITSMDARTQQISLTVHQAEEVAESIECVVCEAKRMDADEQYVYRDLIDAYDSILQQLRDVKEEDKRYNYPEPVGDPSY